jgi:Domain of unknown function (DUF2760)
MLSHGTRWKYAFRAFFSLIFHGRIADDILAAFAAPLPAAPARVAPAPPPPVETPRENNARAAQILAILQRDGRLVDFLMEDLAAYSNEQVGAAVRDVHRGCRQALDKYATLAPVFDAAEGSTVTVDAGTDAARVKVVGNAAGSPPFRGVLRHRGWDATRLELPPLPATGRTVLAPAEVEIP